MSDHREPARWSAQPAEVGELLEGLRSARADGPSPEQLARLRAALSLPGRPPAGGAGWPLRPIATALVVLGASFAVWRAQQPSARTVEPVTAPSIETPADGPASPSASFATSPAAPVERAEPSAKPVAARAERRAPARRPLERTVEAAPADVHAELALLRPARAHVRSGPERSLELVVEHARKHPRGALIEEREVIAIEALLVSNRASEAEQRARSFFARFPRSAHARRVRSLLGEAGADLSRQE